MELELKRLKPGSLDAALVKAAHYRDLNQPDEAESICRDVLEVEPRQQVAWKLLGLALTDRFGSHRAGLLEEALEAFEHIEDDYERIYHLGVAWERAGKAHLERGEAHSAVAGLERALDCYARVEAMRPDSADPVLRWNRCVRLLSTHPELRAAVTSPPPHRATLGD